MSLKKTLFIFVLIYLNCHLVLDTTNAVDSDDESDKESAAGDLIADIFGSSDEEEFEGFGADDVQSSSKSDKKQKTLLSDSDIDNDESSLKSALSQDEILPNISSDEDEGVIDETPAISRGADASDMVSDFELMLAKKKMEQGNKRRKKKDIDVINDNDDIIADLIQKMKVAAEDDRALNMEKKPATKKLAFLPYVRKQLKKVDIQEAFLECGILGAITEWVAPLPDKSLPHLGIRETLLQQLSDFPPIGGDQLKSSGIGKAVMYLYKHPRESKRNKILAGKIINEWSRPIFNLTSNYKVLTKEEREERDYANLPKRRRISAEEMTPRRDIDKALMGDGKAVRPGDKGWVIRARVPQPSHKDYVVRPKSNIQDDEVKYSSKKSLTRYEKKMREMAEKKKNNKQQRAITISIEGRGMAL